MKSKVYLAILIIAVSILSLMSCGLVVYSELLDPANEQIEEEADEQPEEEYVLTGKLDASFDPGSGASGTSEIALQDSHIIIAGNFTSYNGTAINRIARLHKDGTLDTSFTVGTGFDGVVQSITVQSDGKILAGGNFTSFNGTSRTRIARLNANGSLDTTFDPGSGADNRVKTIQMQENKILLGGSFSQYNGNAVGRFIRLTENGSLDTSFNAGASVEGGDVRDIEIDPDGKIIITGNFSIYNGTTRNYIARLNADGSLDSAFDPGAGPDNATEDVLCHTDGTYTVTGLFTAYAGTQRNHIARVKSDGSLDSGFAPNGGADVSIYPVVEVANEKLLVGGKFTTMNGVSINRIARLDSTGALDTSFDPGTGADNVVQCFAVQSDGKVLIGGSFSTYNGTSRKNIARIE